jgi:nucleotide-binding universal stress UspA family protein
MEMYKDGERSLMIDELTAELPQHQESDVEEYLKMIAKSHREPGKGIRTEIRVGSVAPNILETAEALRADLIVMATHGRTGLRRWTYGSVTQKVLHKCKQSMLIVRVLHA